MNNQERLVAFISALKNQEQQSITKAIEKWAGSLKEISRMFRYYKDKYWDEYKDFCDDTKDAIENLKKVSGYQGTKGYVALWNCFKKPEVVEDLERLAKRKEQPWKDGNPHYMPITEAVDEAKRKGRKISVPTLSRMLTPDGPMRYMRKYSEDGKPSRCRIHIVEFRKYLKTLSLIDDPFSEEAFERRQSEIRSEKPKKMRHDSDEGYEKLAKRISKQ